MDARVPTVPRRGRYALLAAYAAYLLWASVSEPPTGGLPPVGPLGLVGVDKWLHALSYGTLSLLGGYALRRRTVRALALVALAAFAYGAGIEVVQAALPLRAFEVADAAANGVGALVGAGGWLAATGLLRRRRDDRQERPG